MYAVVKVNKEKMSTNSPCAACKFLRRKCTQECVFAPYFPPDQPQKFANVHKVYGASNVAKLLNDLPPTQREDAVNSLAYEADARHRDPVYGCVGLISILQHRLKQVQMDLENAKRELANYIGSSTVTPNTLPSFIQHSVLPYNIHPDETILGLTRNIGREVQDNNREQVVLRDEYDTHRSSSDHVLGFNISEFSHTAMSPCLSLGGSYHDNNVYHLQPHQLFLHQLPPQRAE